MMWGIDSSWTLFLDRDGVINERLIDDYVKDPSEFRLLPGVTDALKAANALFGTIVVVTNQQGIGKKRMTERNLSDVHAYCLQQVEAAGGRIDRFYFAPALAADNSELRKPETGMAMQAQADFPAIDFSRSVMIGDSGSDIEFGRRLGMKTVYITTENTQHPVADLTTGSLAEALNRLQQ